MRRQYLVQFRVFSRWSLLTGFHYPLSSCTVYRYLCGIFLDDISTREQFAFLVYCYRAKQFSTIYALCFTGVCVAEQIAPLLNTLSTEADVHWAQKVFSNNGFRMANCFCCLSENAMVCLAHCRQELQQKSWKLQDFFFKTETKTKTKCSRRRPRPRLHDPRPRPRPRLSFLSSRRLETKTLVSRTTSLQLVIKHFVWKMKKNQWKWTCLVTADDKNDCGNMNSLLMEVKDKLNGQQCKKHCKWSDDTSWT